MSWFGKLTFGTVGLLLGGPLGAIAGAALGHILIDKPGGLVRRDDSYGYSSDYSSAQSKFVGAEQAQASYFISLFSILGKLAKTDGVISREEIAVVQKFIDSLPMAEAQKEFARQVFRDL